MEIPTSHDIEMLEEFQETFAPIRERAEQILADMPEENHMMMPSRDSLIPASFIIDLCTYMYDAMAEDTLATLEKILSKGLENHDKIHMMRQHNTLVEATSALFLMTNLFAQPPSAGINFIDEEGDDYHG